MNGNPGTRGRLGASVPFMHFVWFYCCHVLLEGQLALRVREVKRCAGNIIELRTGSARLVHPWPLRAPTWESPPVITFRTFPAVLCFIRLSWHFQSFFSSFVSCACVSSEHGTAGKLGAVAGVSGCLLVEGGLQGPRSPFSCLGIVCASGHEGGKNGLCMASICDFGKSKYEVFRVVGECKRVNGLLFLRPG